MFRFDFEENKYLIEVNYLMSIYTIYKATHCNENLTFLCISAT